MVSGGCALDQGPARVRRGQRAVWRQRGGAVAPAQRGGPACRV